MDSKPSDGAGLELRHLRYVLAIVEAGTFRGAAAMLAVPTRVLSSEIRTVERTLGARLFTRLAPRAVPTRAGHEVAELARRRLARRDHATQALTPDQPRLSVGLLDYGPGQAIQQAAAAEFAAQHPRVDLQIVPMPLYYQLSAVLEGMLNVGFYSGAKPTAAGIAAEVLQRESANCVLLPAGHRLARVEEVTLRDLRGIPLHGTSMEASPAIIARVHDALSRGGWRGRQTAGSALASELIAMVASGAGWSPAPSTLLGWSIPGVAVRPLADGPLLEYDLHVLWREADKVAASFGQLALELRDVIEAVGPQPSHRQEQSGYAALLAARRAERARIARELHDTLLQDILGSELQLDVLRRRLPADLAAEREELRQVAARLARAGREGRETVRALRAVRSSPRELSVALSGAAEELREAWPLEFRMRIDGTPRDLRPRVQEAAYHLGLEAIVNAFRHASAQLVSVSLEYGDDEFRLRVADDGVGIDPEILGARQESGHFGLALMRERADEIGAIFAIHSATDGGTVIELVVPTHTAFGLTQAADTDSSAPGAGDTPIQAPPADPSI